MLNSVEHEKSFITSGSVLLKLVLGDETGVAYFITGNEVSVKPSLMFSFL